VAAMLTFWKQVLQWKETVKAHRNNNMSISTSASYA